MELLNRIGEPALRAVPMALYPTLDSLDSVVMMATSQVPKTTNEIVAMLMIYHNTLLKMMEKEHVASIDQ